MELYTVGLLIVTVLKIEYSETRLIRTPRERNNNDYYPFVCTTKGPCKRYVTLPRGEGGKQNVTVPSLLY